MKVGQSKETFKPITITLETKDEADLLWHLLNYGKPFQGYIKSEKAEELRKIVGGYMWEALNEVHEVR